MMAPISRNTDSRPHSHANGDNGIAGLNPPPSTMAAQLINNLSTAGNAPSRHADAGGLQSLMNEVANVETRAAQQLEAEPGFIEDLDVKLERKHKLIYVFARALLERVASDDPFKVLAQLVKQTHEALDLFLATLREIPEVLDYTLSDDERFPGRGSEPLWKWLFPRLLALLGRRGCENLTKKIHSIFCASYDGLAQSPKLWHLSSSIFRYLKDCVQITLSHLEMRGIIPQYQDLNLVIAFDSQGSVTTDGSSELLRSCSYIVRYAGEGLANVSSILLLLVEISKAATASYDATSAFRDYLAWLLDSFLRVLEVRNRWKANIALHESFMMNTAFLISLKDLLSSLRRYIWPVTLRKGYTVLSIICAEVISQRDDFSEESIGIAICTTVLNITAVCRQYHSVCMVASLNLVPAIQNVLANEYACSSLGKDFKIAGAALRQACGLLSPEEIADGIAFDFDSLDILEEFRSLGLQEPHLETNPVDRSGHRVDDGPPSKRRKMNENVVLFGEIAEDISELLGAQRTADLTGLSQVAVHCFEALGEPDRCKAIELLGRLPCAISATLTLTRENNKTTDAKCLTCDGVGLLTPVDAHHNAEVSQEISNEVILTMTKLVQSPAFIDSRRPRILAMFALGRIATHFDSQDLINLDISSLSQWCFLSLKSSMRELRLAAGPSRTIPAFLRGISTPESLTRKNRTSVMGFLRALIEQEENTTLQETAVLAWGQIARIVKDDELNIVLLSLVRYLGHSNPIISGAAFSEILRIAKKADLTVEKLLGSFWSSIATAAVTELLIRPQITQLLADLLGISVAQFLVLTQSYTLPFLVLNGKVDVIKRISEARNDADNFSVCMDPSNLPPILALLLVQNVPDLDSFVMGLLRRVSNEEFKDLDLGSMTRIEPMHQALYLLKAAGQADESKKSRIRCALQILATRGSENSSRKSITTGTFLKQHLLGIVARIVDVVGDPRDEQMITEKERSVKAIEELLCACLQVALEHRELQASAFSAWDSMLRNLGDEDVETMLESTFAIIIQHWQRFDDMTQKRAEETLQYLLHARGRLIRNMIVSLPSLSAFPQLAIVERKISKLRTPTDVGNGFQIFRRRLAHEDPGVVAQSLVELKAYLRLNQSFLQASAVSDQPNIVVGQLVRSILDTCVKYNEWQNDIAALSAECLGLIGCLDPNRVESVRGLREMVVVSNFHDQAESTEFVLYILQEVIVPAFLSAKDPSLQGFFSYVMQELLERCNFKNIVGNVLEKGDTNSVEPLYRRWVTLPVGVQDTLAPFLNSKYCLAPMEMPKYEYPIFRPETMPSHKLYNAWLRSFTLDLLQKPFHMCTDLIFPPLCRAIRIKDVSVASFILPYLVLHVIIDGTDTHREEIGAELLSILEYECPAESQIRREDMKSCIETVFRILDYLARWMQEKQIKSSSRGQIAPDAERDIFLVKSVVEIIPPELISRRAIQCESYSRALFYWEQYMRDSRSRGTDPDRTLHLQRLQDIYTQIDEPDGIEGISAHLHVLDIDQQIICHRKAGRWTAAQSWYEIQLAENPEDINIQLNLLTCLKESGQHDVLLNYVEGMHKTSQTVSQLLPFATEASWTTGRWAALAKYTSLAPPGITEDFNVNLGRALLALQKQDINVFRSGVNSLRERIGRSLSSATTSSIGTCHDSMLKLHVLNELELIAGTDKDAGTEPANILESLSGRLEVIGAFLSDKQYLLGIRRAAMQLSSLEFTKHDIASAWLTSARLARKGNAIHQSFNAVLHASQLGDQSAMIEHARLLWKEGHHRKAIQSLQGAIADNAFVSHNKKFQATSFTGPDREKPDQQNLLTARAHLLNAKWLDSAGQTQSLTLRTQYQLAAKTHVAWEKGHYYLGRHYNKLLESEKTLPPDRQNETLLTGETAKLVIENYLRALTYGTKYLYQTLPRILTLWLDLGTQVQQPIDPKYGSGKEFVTRITNLRRSHLDQIHARFNKYINRLPAYMYYTALPQIVARIAHPNLEVYKYVQNMIFKVVSTYPQQALWCLLAVCTSNQTDRRMRGGTILQGLRVLKKSEISVDMKTLIRNGEKVTEQLLLACNAGDFQGNRTSIASLSKDLGFITKHCIPSQLAVPVESVLTATLPTLTDNIRGHRAFSRDIVTLDSFSDEVLVLSSLQKPRKLTARGSDGKNYGLMCKPKDDLRKDQRLMEFNSMINRSLKRDAESSRRQLYIKTYAVTPLNEECGLIEWVDGLKTLRDILLGLYKSIGISPNYNEIAIFCEEATKSEDKLPFFTEKVLGNFPPIFHRWFVAQFPEPSAWLAARLRYTRSCAVMSMVGTILGLGDRHGENILFEEGNGGTFHVDFNCLFDKGLTFVKPERVPFRLTHNMIDAMGMYGYEGPFRKSSELTLKLLRQHEETLMTILEAFVHDPTLDLLTTNAKKKKKDGVPQTAQGVLDSIQRKVQGLLPGESVPLGVEGQVDELIKLATNQSHLAGMYIGWCSFF